MEVSHTDSVVVRRWDSGVNWHDIRVVIEGVNRHDSRAVIKGVKSVRYFNTFFGFEKCS
jgi:hypothetical protein